MRESLKLAKTKFGNKPVVAVELGVAAGANAKKILDNLRVSKLFLIDSWRKAYNEQAYEWLNSACDLFDNDNRVFIVRHEAITASEIFLNNQIDYLYVDDNHAPEHVYNELCAWFPKVKRGGIIAGHDWQDNGRVDVGVKMFCNKMRLKYFFSQNDNEQVADWWIIK